MCCHFNWGRGNGHLSLPQKAMTSCSPLLPGQFPGSHSSTVTPLSQGYYFFPGNSPLNGGLLLTPTNQMNYQWLLPFTSNLLLLEEFTRAQDPLSEGIDGGLYGPPTRLHGANQVFVHHTTSTKHIPAKRGGGGGGQIILSPKTRGEQYCHPALGM